MNLFREIISSSFYERKKNVRIIVSSNNAIFYRLYDVKFRQDETRYLNKKRPIDKI